MDGGENTHAAIEVEHQPASATGFAALVTLHGEHDLATSAELRDTLAPLHGSVLLDLTGCPFVDSSVLYVIVTASRQRAHDGERLELVVPVENVGIRRTLDVTGVSEVLTLHG